METLHAVTCFLTHNGKILIVHRSDRVRSYRGKWAGISGYAERPPEDQARQEIREETGLDPSGFRLLAAGDPLEVEDAERGIRWIVHPFLFEIDHPDAIRLDWENTEARWISPGEITDYETVPELAEALEKVWPGRRK
jgi:8-oxo-dGTP diphosphatase